MYHEMFFSEEGLRISYLNKSSRSSYSYLTGATTQNGSVVAGNKYLSLYVLLAGIIGGILLVFSLFLFCKYCRGKSQHGTGVMGLAIGDSWAFGDSSVSIDRHEDVNSLRKQKDGEYRRESVVRNRCEALEVLNGQPHLGLEQRVELENAINTTASTTTKLIDDHLQTSIFLQKQKSIQSKESSPITSFSNSETLECEVAVEIHPGPNQSFLDRNSNTNHSARHNTMGHLHNNSKGSWGKDDHGDRIRGTPYRTQSIEWTKLESSLDFWRKEHSRHQQDDTTQLSKVRYNDTGSLEEVNVENLVDYYVEDELLVHIEEDHERIKKQYRRLWQLRATLEEDEDKKRSNMKLTDIPPPQSVHSPSQSPEREASHTTSFESNTEPLLDEVGKWPPHLLQLPSYEARRQTYRNILTWRLQKMETRNQRHHQGRQPSLDDNSFDSMDTVDTEGSSDASRLDQATTSFESTTDNTDSTSEIHIHRLQQLRADSGYRSLENPLPALKMMYHQQYHVGSTDYDSYEHRIPCLGESVEEGSELEDITNSNEIYPERYSSRKHVTLNLEIKEETAELTSSTKSLSDVSPQWKGWKKQGSDSASKKRRDFSCRSITGEEVLRDYSVDEKSDALFREYSKCDSESSCRKHRLKSYRRLQGHYQDPLISEPSSGLSFNYTDEETELASVPIIRIAPDDDSSDHL